MSGVISPRFLATMEKIEEKQTLSRNAERWKHYREKNDEEYKINNASGQNEQDFP